MIVLPPMARTIYGIKNCDTMQKAFKWMDKNGIAYRFHDYRVDGLSAEQIQAWLKEIPLETLVNLRSTTYKELSDSDKALVADAKTAVSVILQNPSIIKRPLLDNDGQYLLSFKEAEWKTFLRL